MKVDSFSHRLNILMKEKNIKSIDLSNKTGIDKSSISHYLSGNYEPKNEKVILLANALNVSELWLLGHDVPKEKKDELLDNKDAVLYSSIEDLAKDKTEEELLIKCTMLENYNQVKVLELVNMYLKEQGDLEFEKIKSELNNDK